MTIRPGDLVVRIDAKFKCAACETDDIEAGNYEEEELTPDIGQVLTVRAVIYDDFPCSGLWFSDFPDGDERPFAACCYRKIDKADEEFTEQVRACRPIKEKVT